MKLIVRVAYLCAIFGTVVLTSTRSANAQSRQRQSQSVVPWTSVVGNIFRGWIEGITGSYRNERIAGGAVVASRSDRPYMACVAYHPVSALRKYIKIGICSATILTTTRILTGASCFSVLTDGDKSVYVGALKIFWKKPLGTTQVEIKQKILYDGYDFNTNPILHDLAIVVLSTSLSFGSTVNSITLPSYVADGSYYGQTLTSVGYGLEQNVDLSTTDAKTLVSTLLQPIKNQRLKYLAQTVSKNDNDCVSYFTGLSSNTQLGIGGSVGSAISSLALSTVAQLICVSAPAGSGTCLADNGGPMIDSGGTQVGVMSVLLACQDSTAISVGNELSGAHWTWLNTNKGT